MVTCRLIAQTGNQLFIIATTIATALRNGTNYLIPRKTTSTNLWPCYIQHLPEYKGEPISCAYQEPKDFSFQPIPFTNGMYLMGYFQCEDHFKDYRNEIIEALGFKHEIHEGVVSIHVRRGDYLKYPTKHPVITLDYIETAMSFFPNHKFKVFSDDTQWCVDNLAIPYRGRLSIVPTGDPIFEIDLMSKCEHNIIANSTFSWWGAWLNKNPNKRVIAPLTWFGPDNAHLTDKHIIPPEWIRI